MDLYKGSCHCGKVTYEVSGEFEEAMACNCSICSRAGWLLCFVPEAQFRLLSGDNETTDYQFGKKHIHHPFCSTCGVRAYGYGAAPDGSRMFSINARCLEGLDIATLNVKEFDGAAL